MLNTATTFTAEQQRAIEARGVSVALSAGAGCGKTFVLTERFLAQLAPGDDGEIVDDRLHQLIAITFTDRAAREMRDRIRDKCYRRLETAPPNETDRWLSLLRRLDSARISTIHAFCGALLRSHAVEAQLDPRFTVIEQSQADTLLAEITEDAVREILSDSKHAGHEPLLNLIVQFGLERLPSLVAGISNTARPIDFEVWLARSPADLTVGWASYCRETVVPQLLRELRDSPASRDLLNVIYLLGKSSGERGRRCDELSRLLPGLAESKTPRQDLTEIIESARVQGAGGKKTWPDESLYERFKQSAETIRGDAKDALRFLDFDPTAVECDAEAGLNLLALSRDILNRYEARKRELAWIDFHDLLIRAHQLLVNPAHAELHERLAAGIQLLLVDECQDTDPLQVELIKALCGRSHQDGKLFFVGDFKQSIYRFRGADPSVFLRLQQETPPAGQLPLTTNFRSQPAILQFVNTLFCEALSLGIDPSLAYQPLISARDQITPTPAIEFLWAISNEQKTQAGARDAARKQEADFIARRIRGLLKQKEQIVGQPQPDRTWLPRAVEQRDIAILFRALSDVQHYEERLRHYGIDYYLVGGHAFYAQQEIYDVVNLLRALASPADLISLAGALRSPMFSLTDETLFWLARHPDGLGAGLYAEPLPTELDSDQRRRVQFAANRLRQLRHSKDRLSITGLLNEALRLTGYDATLLAEFMGQRKLANLRKLLDQARVFDQSGVLGLTDFIVQLSQFVVEQPREPLAATNPEGTDVVRLMTIHQAKGLEFPVVFVADVGRETRHGDRTAVFHPELGPLVKVPRRDGSLISGLDLHATMNATEDEAERLRLFYVATTRAADYLVLSGGLFHQELESPSSPWLKLLSQRFDLQTGKCLANLPRGNTWKIPEVRVTTEAPPVGIAHGSHSSQHDLVNVIQQTVSLAHQAISPKAADDRIDDLALPVDIDHRARTQFSVSRLSGELESVDELAAYASVGEDETRLASGAAADLGTLVHGVLARVDFRNPASANETILRVMESSGSRGEEHRASIDELIPRFLKSARSRELAAAKVIHREVDFLLAWPPEPGEPSSGKTRYLQGVIDCLYQDPLGHWHLIDYKTNRVSEESLPSLAAHYEMQLGVYSLAVEKIIGEPPGEIALHFLRGGVEHQFPWNAQFKQRIVDKVNQAIERMVNPNGVSELPVPPMTSAAL